MYVCTYICMYVCTLYVCVYVHACMYVCTYICMYVCMYVCTLYVCMYMRVCVYVRTYVRMYVHCMCVCTCVYVCMYVVCAVILIICLVLSDIDNLKSRVEDLNSYNDTLLQEKGQLTTTITELKSGERKLLSMEQTLQAAQQRHSADLNQLELKVKDLQCELDQANLQVATLKSLSGKAPTTSASAERKIKEFEDKVKFWCMCVFCV